VSFVICEVDLRVNAKSMLISRAGSLELFIHQETGLHQESVLAYLSDGQRLTNSNVRDLAGSPDQVCQLPLRYENDSDP
jgi:autophagy-related protein 11